jgi:hypothetical protein
MNHFDMHSQIRYKSAGMGDWPRVAVPLVWSFYIEVRPSGPSHGTHKLLNRLPDAASLPIDLDQNQISNSLYQPLSTIERLNKVWSDHFFGSQKGFGKTGSSKNDIEGSPVGAKG